MKRTVKRSLTVRALMGLMLDPIAYAVQAYLLTRNKGDKNAAE